MVSSHQTFGEFGVWHPHWRTIVLEGGFDRHDSFFFIPPGVIPALTEIRRRRAVQWPALVVVALFLQKGLLNVSKVRTGRVTLARLAGSGDRYAMHVATGNAVTPRAWEGCGRAQPAPQLLCLEIVLDPPVARFAQHVMDQHCMAVYGDATTEIDTLCGLLGFEVRR